MGLPPMKSAPVPELGQQPDVQQPGQNEQQQNMQ